MRVERINIVDPGSVKTISDEWREGNRCDDVIGINQRNHEPIGACYIGSWLKKQGNEVKIIYPRSDNLSIAEVMEGRPQIVAFSCLTYNYPVAKKIAEIIKAYPEIITVIGGYHATCVPDEVSSEYADGRAIFDFVVSQEADYVLGDIVEYLNGVRKKEDIRGLIYKNGEIWVNNFKRFDPNLNPAPFRTKEMMIDRRRQGLYYPAPSQQQAIGLFVWSRGCPFNCKFCVSSKMFPHCPGESSVKYREIGNIIEEVRFCQKEFGTNYGFAVDLNFYGGCKDRVKELCRELSKTGLKWYAMSRLDVDPEIFEMMKIGGCSEIGFGVESLTKQIKSGSSMNISAWRAKAKEVAAMMTKMGILSKFYYILGGPGATLDDIKTEGGAICEVNCDEMRLSWMMISPGTPSDGDMPSFEDLKKQGCLEKDGEDLSLFSTDYPIIRVPEADADALQKLRLDFYREFYSPKRYSHHAKAMIAAFPHLEQSFGEWDGILKESLGRGWRE